MLLNRLRRFFFSEVKKRAPIAKTVRLQQKIVYIIPNRFSLSVLFLLGLLLICAVNYDSNLLYLFSFWLLALLLLNFYLTFRNLSGLSIEAVKAEHNFAGDDIAFTVRLTSNRSRFALTIKMQDCVKHFNLAANSPLDITLYARSDIPGQLDLPAIKLHSIFPFNCAVAWSYLFLDLSAWVFPSPVMSAVSSGEDGGLNMEQDHQVFLGNEDFYALEQYQPGQAMHRVHWPSLAKRDQLQSKQFVDYQQRDVWIRWQNYEQLPIDSRLQHFSYLIEWYSQQGMAFGLEMPAITIDQDLGDEHRLHCLIALAQFAYD